MEGQSRPIAEAAPGGEGKQPAELKPEMLLCAECGHPVDKDDYLMDRSKSYPYGGRAQDGRPLCAAHRITRCTGCDKLLPRHETNRVVVRWRPREHSFWEVRPHWEEVFTRYCAGCAAGYRDPRPPKYHVTPLQAVVLTLLAILITLVVWVFATNRLG